MQQWQQEQRSRLEATDRKALDALARRFMECRAELDTQLHNTRRRRFPIELFDQLWQAVLDYTAAMQDQDWLHKTVAGECNGFREYLQLQEFKTPEEVLQRAERIECLVFSGYDPYFEGDEPPGL